MNVQRHHSYLAQALHALLLRIGETAPDVAALEQNYAFVAAEIERIAAVGVPAESQAELDHAVKLLRRVQDRQA